MLDRTKYNKMKTGLNVLLKENWNSKNGYKVRVLCKPKAVGPKRNFLK